MRGIEMRLAACAIVACAAWSCKAPPVPEAGQAGAAGTGGPAVAAADAAAAEAAQPAWTGTVEFSETEFDLGKVKRGDPASHTFTVTNKTNRTLNIKNVRGS